MHFYVFSTIIYSFVQLGSFFSIQNETSCGCTTLEWNVPFFCFGHTPLCFSLCPSLLLVLSNHSVDVSPCFAHFSFSLPSSGWLGTCVGLWRRAVARTVRGSTWFCSGSGAGWPEGPCGSGPTPGRAVVERTKDFILYAGRRGGGWLDEGARKEMRREGEREREAGEPSARGLILPAQTHATSCCPLPVLSLKSLPVLCRVIHMLYWKSVR